MNRLCRLQGIKKEAILPWEGPEGPENRHERIDQQATDLQARVMALYTAGVLKDGQANSLIVLLNLQGNMAATKYDTIGSTGRKNSTAEWRTLKCATCSQ